MSNKGILASILIVIFLGMIIFLGNKTVSNVRVSPDDISIGSSSSVSSATSFPSKLKSMSADEVIKDKMTLLKTDIKAAGTGDKVVKNGDNITVNYRGWLATDNKQVFDESFKRGDSGFTFTVGQGVISGWSQGVAGMKLGEVRRLKIPSELGYGAAGSPPVIPANSDLIFDVELLQFN